MGSSKFIKFLISITIIIFVGFVTVGLVFKDEAQESAISIETSGQPTVGYPSAKVHVVVFEEPKCSLCKTYNNKIFPEIKKEFIDTNKVLYTVIPVSFLPSSLPAADALLCVYYQDPKYPNPDLFFTFLDYLYQNQPPEHEDWATEDKLIEMASQASQAIHLRQLRSCTDQQSHRNIIVENTEYGRKLMGGRIMTPTVYVDGLEVKKLTKKNIKKQISKALEAKGVAL